ncbi:MAG: molybdopterin cofactor-binding domain-containing protein, partial [Xanthobacteraceae bacterium]
MKYFGARMQRLEYPALLAGRGRFVDDIHLDGTMHVAFVRSPHAHARIQRIDASAARMLAGVQAVFTHADLPDGMRGRVPLMVPHPHIRHPLMPYPLAAEEVNYVGELVAAVLADNRYIAEDAASLVTVDYELLSPVVDCRTAIEPGAPRAHANVSDNIAAKFTLGYGNVDAAFETAHTVVDVALIQQRGSGHAIECRGVLANYDKAGDKLTVWNAGQTPHIDRRNLEILLRLDPSQVRVIMPDVGGGFGTKALFYPETA